MAEVKTTAAAATVKKVETPKTFTFKVVETCYWNNEYFKKGDIVKLDSKENVPQHFAELK